MKYRSILLLERGKYGQSWLYGPILAEIITIFNILISLTYEIWTIFVDFVAETTIIDIINELNRFVKLTGYKRTFLT